jgi:quaternary ammonium compound-resistance protein SugE
MAWFWLILGGLFEVGFTTSLRFVDGFKNLPWTLAVVGILWFQEPSSTIRVLLILAIVAAIAALKLTA